MEIKAGKAWAKNDGRRKQILKLDLLKVNFEDVSTDFEQLL